MPQLDLPPLDLPTLPQGWAYFVDRLDLLLAFTGLILAFLLIIWWRQQTRAWFRIVAASFLAALLLCIGSYYLFVVPPYYASCPPGCTGWRGYPLPVALIDLNGVSYIGLLDFLLNLLILWLLWLGGSLIWRLLGMAIRWERRSWRARLLFITILLLLPWALLPRILDPPQPQPRGEDQRLAINALRSAEFTYRITGLWVQRLAFEDLRRVTPETETESVFGVATVSQVCLRGYTYFYIPWQRYRITLDPSGVTPLQFTEQPLTGSCWGDE